MLIPHTSVGTFQLPKIPLVRKLLLADMLVLFCFADPESPASIPLCCQFPNAKCYLMRHGSLGTCSLPDSYH